MSQPRALIFSTIQGHASIAEALSSQLQHHHWLTHTASYADPALDVYRWVYRHAPQLCQYYYQAIQWTPVRHAIAAYTTHSHHPVFTQALHDFPAELFIGTSYGFDALILAEQRRRHQLHQPVPPFINIVVDPRTFFRTNVVPTADMNCVFDQTIADRCQAVLPQMKTVVTGWFVRDAFNSRQPKAVVRRQLGLAPDRLTLLFAAGSEGETKSARLIPQLLATARQPLQLILAAGSNQQLLQEFEPYVRQYAAHPQVRFHTLPFTRELHHYVRAADLMVGKAGPNSIFEAAACTTPFLATTHIAGQEDGNLEIIKEYQLGYVEEELPAAAQLLSQIIAQPDRLIQFVPSLQRLAQYNQAALDRLLAAVERLPTWQSRSSAAQPRL